MSLGYIDISDSSVLFLPCIEILIAHHFLLAGGVGMGNIKDIASLHYKHSIWVAVPASSIKNLPEHRALVSTVGLSQLWHQLLSKEFNQVPVQATLLGTPAQCEPAGPCIWNPFRQAQWHHDTIVPGEVQWEVATCPRTCFPQGQPGHTQDDGWNANIQALIKEQGYQCFQQAFWVILTLAKIWELPFGEG